jgi:hypothetical protein
MSKLNPRVIVEETVQQAPSSKLVLDRSFVRKALNVTLFNLTNIEYQRLDNIGAVSVSGAKGGQDGQSVRILGDGQTTIKHLAAVTKPYEQFHTNTGADKLLLANVVYTFHRFLLVGDRINGRWHEDA